MKIFLLRIAYRIHDFLPLFGPHGWEDLHERLHHLEAAERDRGKRGGP